MVRGMQPGRRPRQAFIKTSTLFGPLLTEAYPGALRRQNPAHVLRLMIFSGYEGVRSTLKHERNRECFTDYRDK